MMSDKHVAVVQGAPTPTVQQLMRQFIAGLDPAVRVAGVIEDDTAADGGDCTAGDLRERGDFARFKLMQDREPGGSGCRLDPEALVAACEAVRRSIGAGADLVVLNKFGKAEADRSGLAAAFASAIEAEAPVLTSVAPRMQDAWDRFAGPLYVILPPDLGAIQDWWGGLARGAADRSN